MTDEDLVHQLRTAGVNHCLSFEQVCDEWIEDYGIENGQFDNVSSCKYKVPTVMDIGRVYQTLIMDVEKSYKNTLFPLVFPTISPFSPFEAGKNEDIMLLFS